MIFDTTYKTNKYSIPLVLFIDVNHYQHSLLFGMTILRCEDAQFFLLVVPKITIDNV
jgi:MULE transposase domain